MKCYLCLLLFVLYLREIDVEYTLLEFFNKATIKLQHPTNNFLLNRFEFGREDYGDESWELLEDHKENITNGYYLRTEEDCENDPFVLNYDPIYHPYKRVIISFHGDAIGHNPYEIMLIYLKGDYYDGRYVMAGYLNDISMSFELNNLKIPQIYGGKEVLTFENISRIWDTIKEPPNLLPQTVCVFVNN
ncbi:hypothetical protein HZS_7445 [Henneguya salminicola]|nr:hypothetical protein HZS_7445 [Henneguya salminicola]